MQAIKTISNKNIPGFLTPYQVQQWVRYFAKELDVEIDYEYFYDAYVNLKYPATNDKHQLLSYDWMDGYFFGLTPTCAKDIESSILNKKRLDFYLKKKGRRFLYTILFKQKDPEPIITEEIPFAVTLEPDYYQYSIFDYVL